MGGPNDNVRLQSRAFSWQNVSLGHQQQQRLNVHSIYQLPKSPMALTVPRKISLLKWGSRHCPSTMIHKLVTSSHFSLQLQLVWSDPHSHQSSVTWRCLSFVSTEGLGKLSRGETMGDWVAPLMPIFKSPPPNWGINVWSNKIYNSCQCRPTHSISSFFSLIFGVNPWRSKNVS